MSNFGIRLRELRKSKKLSGEQLGKHLGVTKTAVSYWETNDVIPGALMIKNIADFFGVSMDYLMGDGYEELIKQAKEIEGLTDALISSGLLKKGQRLTQEEYSKIIEYIKANKKFILSEDKLNE